MIYKRKICVVTGTRAEYGLLKNLIKLIEQSDEFELQLIATGTHLSDMFGLTYKEIEADGFHILHKINLNLSDDTPKALSNSTSIGLKNFGQIFELAQPDLLIVLGDRYEILSAVIAAMFARIPIAHIHGGELTEGLIDEAIRHSITKFSHLHFVANEDYKRRVIQLGENPRSVFNVGGLGVDAIKNIALLSKPELEESLGIKFKSRNLLVTFHPVTLENNTSNENMQELLNALAGLENTCLIFTMPNADTDSYAIMNLIKDFVSKNKDAYFFPSLGQLRYLSCMVHVDAVVGNSSSGIAEAPSFKKPTINIGDRQKGRVQSKSIINCPATCLDIRNAINKSYTLEFQNLLLNIANPYGNGGASEKILSILGSINFESLIKKEFYDLNLS